uniref:uncharacterized protein LOC120331846 n=1 Tax=Styela clava TaxID=7725 RepID=UPI00193AD2EC|nr:uncharacterized protein LOC120331846 [Styela clava]
MNSKIALILVVFMFLSSVDRSEASWRQFLLNQLKKTAKFVARSVCKEYLKEDTSLEFLREMRMKDETKYREMISNIADELSENGFEDAQQITEILDHITAMTHEDFKSFMADYQRAGVETSDESFHI